MSGVAVVAVLACDLCQGQPAEPWRITQAGDTEYRIDLCKACAKPLRELRKSGRTEEPAKPRRRRSGITITPDLGDR